MGARWIKIASIYFILGIAVGLFMSATIQLEWAAGHGHVNLAGWASMGIIGAVYSIYPEAGDSRLGIWTFWLYQIGMPILLISMFIIQIPPPFDGWIDFIHIFTFGGGGLVTIAVILFIISVFKNVHAKPSN